MAPFWIGCFRRTVEVSGFKKYAMNRKVVERDLNRGSRVSRRERCSSRQTRTRTEPQRPQSDSGQPLAAQLDCYESPLFRRNPASLLARSQRTVAEHRTDARLPGRRRTERRYSAGPLG